MSERDVISFKSKRAIRRELKALRALIDSNPDPVVTRIAYAMEHALRWAILDTVGWMPMDNEAIVQAAILRKGLEKK